MSAACRTTAIRAVARRELGGLLSSPLSYLFILFFVAASAVFMFWIGGNEYLSRLVADLQPLHGAMPWLIAVLVPALAMGAWSKERESGTEELLMTMPLSTLDAVLGKWLAISVYYTFALAFVLTIPITIQTQGNPDWGVVFANFAGWWLAGVVASAVALLASVMVGLPPIAFVLGVILCAAIIGHNYIGWLGSYVVWFITGASASMPASWFDAFNRGVIPLGHVIGALAVAASAIGVAVAVLSSRRWRPSDRGTAWGQVVSLLFAVVIAINVAGLANRMGSSLDTTADRLSTLSSASRTVIADFPGSATIHVFITADEALPPEMRARADEMITTMDSIRRASAGKITVKVARPPDAFTGAGPQAEKEFGIKPGKAMADLLTGKQPVDIFFGFAVTSGANKEVVSSLLPGMSVEYEAVLALRSVAYKSKPVLGVAVTELGMHGEQGQFNPMMGGMSGGSPEWEIMKEWRRQYDVRKVDLNAPVSKEIKALVVGQPSSLTQAQLINLHQYIWRGGPTLLLEDALPLFKAFNGRGDLIPREPRRQGGMQEGGESAPKGDLAPLMRSLGIDWQGDQVVWSTYMPSHEYRNTIPDYFLWTRQSEAQLRGKRLLTGIRDVMFMLPGELRELPERPKGLSFAPLISISGNASDWGRMMVDDAIQRSFQGIQIKGPDFEVRDSGDQSRPAIIAAEITGTLSAAYDVQVEKLAQGVSPSSTAAGDTMTVTMPPGSSSPAPVRVVVIGDTDFAADQMFRFSRLDTDQPEMQSLRFLQNLRNIHFLGQVVDDLMGEPALIELRGRRGEPRRLQHIDDIQSQAAEAIRKAMARAKEIKTASAAAVRKRFDDDIERITNDPNLSDDERQEQAINARKKGQARMQSEMERLDQDEQLAIRRVQSQQNQVLNSRYLGIKLWAIFIPSALLIVLAVIVFEIRRQRERMSIPAARKRA